MAAYKTILEKIEEEDKVSKASPRVVDKQQIKIRKKQSRRNHTGPKPSDSNLKPSLKKAGDDVSDTI